jgi:hypothetical protein
MPESLDAVYAPFVASLRAGGLGPPPEGEWPAELVAAHIARNNDLIAEAAEQIAAGHEVRYDNAAGVDDAELAEYAASVGGLPGLAREVERSAARLEKARDSLGDRAGTPVHVIIRDHGEIVRDGPLTIGAFIEGNASFHLDLHHDQLKSLELEPEGGPPAEFDEYQLVLLERSATAPNLDEEASLRQDAPGRADGRGRADPGRRRHSRDLPVPGRNGRAGTPAGRGRPGRPGRTLRRAGDDLVHREGRHRVERPGRRLIAFLLGDRSAVRSLSSAR